MATYNNIQPCETYTTNTSLTTKQYTFVAYVGGVIVGPTLGQACIGVLQNAPAAGQVGSVAYTGSPMVYAGATIAAGAVISADATGRATTALTTHIGLGFAREAAVVGQLIKIDFNRGGNAV